MCVSVIPRRTGALYIPVNYFAIGVDTAHRRLQARIPAHLIYAAFLGELTITIYHASIAYTFNSRISLIAVGTQTRCQMIGHLANCILATRKLIGTRARIFTLATDATSIAGAIFVVPATD